LVIDPGGIEPPSPSAEHNQDLLGLCGYLNSVPFGKIVLKDGGSTWSAICGGGHGTPNNS
jgi:hypothetical protein